MNELSLLQAGLKAVWIVFAFAFGASAGSLINVLVYRLPRGLDVVWTGSQCPCCETKLTWRENIPVFGWIALGGRCRFCKSKISAEYPLVETLVGLLWAGMFVVYFALPAHAHFLGVDWTAIRPEWARYDADVDGWPRTTWPIFITHLFIVASLVAMTLVDAKTFTIPLVLPWAALAVGITFHTFGAALVQSSYMHHLQTTAANAIWSLPTPGWSPFGSHGTGLWWIGASIGATLGLILANILLHYKLIRRSFEDYPEWEINALKQQGIDPDAPPTSDPPDEGIPVGEHVGPGTRLILRFTLVWLACTLALGYFGSLLASTLHTQPWLGLAIGFLGGPILAALACRPLTPKPAPAPSPVEHQTSDTPHPTSPLPPPSVQDLWIAYPHARREMLKELIFLTPPIALGWLGGFFALHFWGSAVPPLWLMVLCGTLMGALIGGGAIWAIRILGSLGFGKEAMGLGDVHMMAGVGACLGWVDATLAIPFAAVVGLYFVILSMMSGRPAGRAMPFGPYLAIGTLLVLFGRPLVDLGLTTLLNAGPGSPVIHLP